MERQVRMSGDRFIEQMRSEFEQTMRRVAEAVNQAPNGQWISGSEVQVLELMTEFRRKTFETALQMRVDEAEGGFFPRWTDKRSRRSGIRGPSRVRR
ncbi:MAG TPA: hypothetical protein VIM11_11895 [Tepidisphaeraceae bacterium]|jgi:hypothetical protein